MGSGWTIQLIVNFTVIYVAIVEILVIGHIDIARTAVQRTEWTVMQTMKLIKKLIILFEDLLWTHAVKEGLKLKRSTTVVLECQEDDSDA